MKPVEGKTRSRWQRRFFHAAIACILLLLSIGITCLILFIRQLDQKIQSTGQRIASEACGTDVTIGNVMVSFFDGELDIYDVVIGNPPGYETPAALRIGRIHVRFTPTSLLTENIHLKSLEIRETVVHYERENDTSNIHEIMESFQEFAAKPRDRKMKYHSVHIDRFHFISAELRLRNRETHQEKDLILNPIKLYNVGKNATLPETVLILFTAISAEVAATAIRSSDWLKKTRDALGGTMDRVSETTEKLFQNMRQAFEQAAETATVHPEAENPEYDRQIEDAE